MSELLAWSGVECSRQYADLQTRHPYVVFSLAATAVDRNQFTDRDADRTAEVEKRCCSMLVDKMQARRLKMLVSHRPG